MRIREVKKWMKKVGGREQRKENANKGGEEVYEKGGRKAKNGLRNEVEGERTWLRMRTWLRKF
jgi:hypothetical protein